MVALIEIPFFLSLFVSFYKECLILKRNNFVLIVFQILFQRWLITNCCKLWLLLGLVLNKFRKNIKEDSIIPRLEIYLSVLIFDQNLQSYSTPIVLTTSVHSIFKEGGGGARKFENNEDQKKNFSTQNQSVFLPKIRWRWKKKGY